MVISLKERVDDILWGDEGDAEEGKILSISLFNWIDKFPLNWASLSKRAKITALKSVKIFIRASLISVVEGEIIKKAVVARRFFSDNTGSDLNFLKELKPNAIIWLIDKYFVYLHEYFLLLFYKKYM